MTKNAELTRMRSYSSIFSSTSFNRLLKYSDYSFLDSKINRYDISKVGKKIETYSDYIRYIYGELRKNYRSEYIYKNTFINELLLKQYGVKDTIAINEFRVGKSIADVALFNGISKVFEIKTELDSDKRLYGQLSDYEKIFQECYIITHESIVEKYIKEDDSVGIIVLFENPRSLRMQEIRPAVRKYKIDPDMAIRSLRTNEYQAIAKDYYGTLPEMNSFNMFKICNELIKEIPSEILYTLFNEQIKKRKSNTEYLKSYKSEIRQIALALNFNSKKYQQLQEKLNKTIRI